MKEAYNYLDNLLEKNDTLVLAISGGPDSMYLLNLVLSFREKYNLNIICAHVNHGLRKESDEEKKFVENYCIINNIIFEYLKIEKYTNNKFTEQEARNIRYKFFEKIVKKYKAKYLMTAHHGDDLIETVMMRLVRGSNLKGYIGIPIVSHKDGYDLVRPLLYLTKKDITDYLDKKKIKYVTDLSNNNLEYTRNRYRKNILPVLKEEYANVHLKFLDYSKELESYLNYFNRLLDEKYNRIVRDNYINIDMLIKEDHFIQSKIIERLIENIQNTEIFNISKEQLKNIINLLRGNNREINLADGFIARKSYNKLYIEKNNKVSEYKIEFDKEITILNKYHFEIINESDSKSNFIIRLDSNEIELPLIIRSVMPGDKIKVKNLNGHKKVSDVFVESKIDKKERDGYPIVCDSKNNIIWIPGLKKSIFDKEKNEKYDIIVKCKEEKDEKSK